MPGILQSADKVLLDAFTDLRIDTDILNVHDIPGKIEAEEFITNYGWAIENCTDAGAGFDMGYTDDGDFLDYLIDVAEEGNYKISCRVASGNSAGGKIEFELVSEEGSNVKLNTLAVHSTGGWQKWITISSEIELPAGEHRLRILVNKREFNLNWMNLERQYPTGINEYLPHDEHFKLYPNPAKGKLYVEFSSKINSSVKMNIINLHGNIVKKYLCGNSSREEINLEGIKRGMYLLQVVGDKFISSKRFVISN